MPFYEELAAATSAERAYLLSSPIIVNCLRGDVSRESYLAFLGQAFHHVRHTTPLLMALAPYRPSSKTPSGTSSNRAAWPLSSATQARANRSP